MKHIQFILVALISVLTLSACNLFTKSSKKDNPYLKATPVTMQFESKGGMQPVTVDANVKWTASVNESWCKVNIVSVQTIEVTVDENETSAQRSAIITVSGSGKSTTVTVTQSAGDYSIDTPHDDVTDRPAYGRQR